MFNIGINFHYFSLILLSVLLYFFPFFFKHLFLWPLLPLPSSFPPFHLSQLPLSFLSFFPLPLPIHPLLFFPPFPSLTTCSPFLFFSPLLSSLSLNYILLPPSSSPPPPPPAAPQ